MTIGFRRVHEEIHGLITETNIAQCVTSENAIVASQSSIARAIPNGIIVDSQTPNQCYAINGRDRNQF